MEFREKVTWLPNNPLDMFVIVTKVYGRRYIAGIRLQAKNCEPVQLGYIRQSGEVLVGECLRIADFQLAHSLRGVRGMVVIPKMVYFAMGGGL